MMTKPIEPEAGYTSFKKTRELPPPVPIPVIEEDIISITYLDRQKVEEVTPDMILSSTPTVYDRDGRRLPVAFKHISGDELYDILDDWATVPLGGYGAGKQLIMFDRIVEAVSDKNINILSYGTSMEWGKIGDRNVLEKRLSDMEFHITLDEIMSAIDDLASIDFILSDTDLLPVDLDGPYMPGMQIYYNCTDAKRKKINSGIDRLLLRFVKDFYENSHKWPTIRHMLDKAQRIADRL
ncbi:hypothetical protein COV93_07520 [Candidatus Woesearchaeota archaeon CG11_big_fil_rev_8_21_14_0_20_43_8]|nr:MAG: hypothetical protein COV93_07520 [Candidatus Woesearchaeota archaeon CG11_big_fil_rev_8_21_14_0_20_43_8]PIO06950.1 MAG: hypothetical protein COT47_02120 [Candidatus Woesearchaeota archaeon CG08_land_8_20_14_0_20_43_7]